MSSQPFRRHFSVLVYFRSEAEAQLVCVSSENIFRRERDGTGNHTDEITVRLQSGALAVFSPTALTPEVKAEVAKLGEVKYITALDLEVSFGQWANL
jgi:hypothetical protein